MTAATNAPAGSAEPTLVAPRPSRSPWQRFYGAVHRWRHAHYQKRAHSLSKPVISIGNLHWGGGGKTPLTIAVARHLRERGLQVTILSRGYGRQSQGTQLVSRGDGALLTATDGGDEPVLMARALPGVSVVVDGDRYRGGLYALQNLNPAPDLFLLDDGFSHLRLARDLDLLAFPLSDPFGGGRLPPGGRLREPLASAARAHAALLTGGSEEGSGERLAEALRPYGFRGPGFLSRSRLELGQTTWQGESLPAHPRVLAVSAIARPQAFVDGARRQHEIVGQLDFPDHHRYNAQSLSAIRKRFSETDADLVLTTDKDRVKLEPLLRDSPHALPCVCLSLEAEPERPFFQWLEQWLDGRFGA